MSSVMAVLFVFVAAIRLATPLILGALGDMFSERSGVVNIAIEGLMLTGAFAAVVGSYFTNNAWFGVLCAIAAGAALAFVHAIVVITYRGNQTISGTAINIMAAAFTVYLMRVVFNTEGLSPTVAKLPQIGIGKISFNPIVYLTVFLVAACWFVMYKTKLGLHIDAAGNHPAAADTAGINVNRIRYIGTILSGAFAGLAGACLSIGDGSSFQRNMTNGRGFMAVAVLIIGKWHPVGAMVAALLFGLADAIQISVSSVASIPSQLVAMIPYVITLLALAGFMGKQTPPLASGTAYEKENR